VHPALDSSDHSLDLAVVDAMEQRNHHVQDVHEKAHVGHADLMIVETIL
jgi:hypothetical protein